MSRTYNEVKQEVEQIRDGLGMPIDDGVKQVVIALRLWNFPTSASCEGHLDRGAPYPWVEIYAPDQEEKSWLRANRHQRNRLTKLLNEFYEATNSKCRFGYEDIGIYGGFRLIDEGVKSMKKSATSLERQRKDFDVFAEFLIDRLK